MGPVGKDRITGEDVYNTYPNRNPNNMG